MPSSSSWRSVTYVEDKFVAVASSTTNTAYSTDGITWSQSTMPSSASWQSVTYGEDKFVAVGGFTTAAYSTIGITWIGSFEAEVQAILNKQTLIPTKTLESGSTDEIVGGITLSAGDQIRTNSQSSDLTIHVYGVELS
jgi:hypothetical protein